ncbi:S-adenosyl-L-methionine-dependent methyltransferase [Xylariales sp. AK1849]|nr:S-adenosyl-L-methionine-dependent methyltransferase [Xylariales sp. AK1849]
MSKMNFHEESTASWETNASFWDEHVGHDGNKYWKLLQKPALRRMITVHPESRALDLATGNGLAARWLANEGCASVLATDYSAGMLQHATQRQSAQEAAKISYRQLDVTSPAAFAAFLQSSEASGGFDIVLINMAIMDIATIEPLASALPKLLKPDGVFVATVLHPVFFTSGATRSIELIDATGIDKTEIIRAKVIRNYLDVPPTRGVAQYGQPAQQIYFHRPLPELFGTFFKAGLVMDAIEEPAFAENEGTEGQLGSHSNYTQLPAILAFRLRNSHQL